MFLNVSALFHKLFKSSEPSQLFKSSVVWTFTCCSFSIYWTYFVVTYTIVRTTLALSSHICPLWILRISFTWYFACEHSLSLCSSCVKTHESNFFNPFQNIADVSVKIPFSRSLENHGYIIFQCTVVQKIDVLRNSLNYANICKLCAWIRLMDAAGYFRILMTRRLLLIVLKN